jgi:peptidoglycan/xylan/chitin deacetylase (PgdA/CDA1 family)
MMWLVGFQLFLLLVCFLLSGPEFLVSVAESFEARVVFRGKAKTQKQHKKPQLALTIDDAPYLGDKNGPRKQGESRLAEILQILKEHDVKVTFFVMSHEDGQRWYEPVLQQAVLAGHELGNHGTVDEKTVALGIEEMEQKFLHCDAYLRRLRGNKWFSGKKWFRPGGGFFSNEMLLVVGKHGYSTALGNVFLVAEPWLSKMPWFSPFTAWFYSWRARPGAVLVVHDRICTPQVLRRLLPSLTKRFTLVTLSELEL